MVTITKKGGANPMYHDPRSGRQSSNHVTTGRFSRASSNVGTGTRWFTRSVLIFAVPMFLRILDINILKLTSTCFKKKGIFTNRSFNKNLYRTFMSWTVLYFVSVLKSLELNDDFDCLIRKPTPHMDSSGPIEVTSWTTGFHAGMRLRTQAGYFWGAAVRWRVRLTVEKAMKQKGFGKKKRRCA